MPRVSKRRARQNRAYTEVRRKYLAEHPRCETGRKYPCLSKSTEIHHRRGRVGSLLTDTRWFMAVCCVCHDYIEENREEAREKGWLLSRDNKAMKQEGVA